MSGVFQNIAPPPPTARRVCPPTVFGARGGYFWKTPDTALYSTYESTLWVCLWKGADVPKTLPFSYTPRLQACPLRQLAYTLYSYEKNILCLIST
jgi:hypothetical protein